MGDTVVHHLVAGAVTEKVNPAKDIAIHLVAGAATEKVNPAKDTVVHHLVAGAATEKVNLAREDTVTMITIMVTVSLVKDQKVEVMVNLKKDSAVLLAALVGAATGKENLTKDTVVHHLHHLAAGVVMEKVKVANRIPILHGAVLALVKAKGTVIYLLAAGAVTEKARVTIQQVHLVQGKV